MIPPSFPEELIPYAPSLNPEKLARSASHDRLRALDMHLMVARLRKEIADLERISNLEPHLELYRNDMIHKLKAEVAQNFAPLRTFLVGYS